MCETSDLLATVCKLEYKSAVNGETISSHKPVNYDVDLKHIYIIYII